MEKPTLEQIEKYKEDAKKYAEESVKNLSSACYQWIIDALYCAYLTGIENAFHIRIIH